MARASFAGVTSLRAEEVLSSAQRKQFEREGFLTLDSLDCPSSLLEGAVADLDGLYGGEKRKEGGIFYSGQRIQDAWWISSNVRELALSPLVRALLAELYGRTPLPFQTLNFLTGTQQSVHSDTIHFNSMPAGFMCGVWVALEDVDMDNGPLVYYPGSHFLPEITLEDMPADGERDYARYERYIAELIEREGLRPAYGTLKKGQALIWSANLLHGGMPVRDPRRTRHSQVTHFFFEGCRYYTPLLSGEGYVEFRNPTWITEDATPPSDDSPYDPDRIRETAATVVPANATVLVMSKGDEDLVRLPGRRAVHFPRNESEGWLGYYPETDEVVLSALEVERARGAGYLLLPSASFWWLEHYAGLADHLARRAEEVARDESCVIFAL